MNHVPIDSALMDCIANEPEQPGRDTWAFVEDLKAPLWSRHSWDRRVAATGEASLAGGVTLEFDFPDPKNCLETAYADFRAFLKAGAVPHQDCRDPYAIALCMDAAMPVESFRLEVKSSLCRLIAGTSEGIRRGIFHLEELMLRAGRPYLPLGVTQHDYPIRRRISRCFYSPIKRPPLNRDELLDDIEYYPDEYLNRLAHDGINGLWISITLRDVCVPQHCPDLDGKIERRLNKLRKTVEQCARFGIKIYVFCIEPRAFNPQQAQTLMPSAEQCRDVSGHTNGLIRHFCTGSETGLRYLEDTARTFFASVPGLGGMINITMGERPTHCFSNIDSLFTNNCKRCSKRDPSDIIAETQAALARGIHSVDPQAELISWFYLPEIRETAECDPKRAEEILLRIFAKTPAGVILQLNCESLGEAQQLGKPRPVLDYSLAYIGPSRFFETVAGEIIRNGASVSAKLQVGCSHEVATVPFVPVPGNIFRRYKRLIELGVTTVLQCWYFGNYPSVMTRAAFRCAMRPLPESEDEFLAGLAASEWGGDTFRVVQAWKHFRDAYENFPANVHFSHFGPVHDCITWPLHLKPVDAPIAPSWQLGHPVSGDRIGECFAYYHDMDETLALARSVADGWDAGLRLLLPLVSGHGANEKRIKEIGVAEALGLQFRSAVNVLQFYAWREELFWQKPEDQRHCLLRMRELVDAEIQGTRRLAELCRLDSRLGFHSEAEGYKYFPAKLIWRAQCLETLLNNSFPEVEKMMENGMPLFPCYSGAEPKGPVYLCRKTVDSDLGHLSWSLAPVEQVEPDSPAQPGFQWQAQHDGKTIFLRAVCRRHTGNDPEKCVWGDGVDADRIIFNIEPRRLWPGQRFHIDSEGAFFHDNVGVTMDRRCRVIIQSGIHEWTVVLSIPFECFGGSPVPGRPMRINVERPDLLGASSAAWIAKTPLPDRLHFGTANPQDFGWLVFGKENAV